jgi:hypothetical protein
MIIRISQKLFEADDPTIQEKIVGILECVIMEKVMWSMSDINAYFIASNAFQESILFKSYLSDYQKRFKFTKDNFLRLAAYQTKEHSNYFTTFHIGDNNGDINIHDAHRIITLASGILVENDINDWKFIVGIVNKYGTDAKRRNVYGRIKRAIDSKWLVPINAGGRDGIEPRLNSLSKDVYRNIVKYKLCTIFDSDRRNSTELKDEQKKIIRWIKGGRQIDDITAAVDEKSDHVFWHMLYKRSIENYLPIDILEQYLTLPEDIRNELAGINDADLDFYTYDAARLKRSNIKIKTDFPEVFMKTWNKNGLDNRCAHHLVKYELPSGVLEDVNEIELMLLKIAKLI